MPAPIPQGNHDRQIRERLEEQLLAEVKQAESAFRSAPPEGKEAAAEVYRQTLQRFNDLILDRKPPGSSSQP